MKTKQKIIIAIFALVLSISVVLNIALLCTDVFQGTYKFSNEKYNYEIIFFDNTYSENHYIKYNYTNLSGTFQAGDLVYSNYGFFQYIPKEKYSKATYDTIILEHKRENTSGSISYKRNSVFSFTYAPDSENAETYICITAVWLQVLYAFLILGSLIFILIYYNRVALPEIRKKIQQNMSDSLDVIQLDILKKDGE